MHNVSALKIGCHPPEGENDPRSEKTSVRVTRQTPTRLYQDTASDSNSGLFQNLPVCNSEGLNLKRKT